MLHGRPLTWTDERDAQDNEGRFERDFRASVPFSRSASGDLRNLGGEVDDGRTVHDRLDLAREHAGGPSAHFSLVSIMRVPTSRTTDSSFGKMQAGLVRRLTSRFWRSMGLVADISGQRCFGCRAWISGASRYLSVVIRAILGDDDLRRNSSVAMFHYAKVVSGVICA